MRRSASKRFSRRLKMCGEALVFRCRSSNRRDPRNISRKIINAHASPTIAIVRATVQVVCDRSDRLMLTDFNY